MAQKTRDELKVLFKKGAKPTEYDFRDFIDSTLNQKDDGIKKSQGADTPLKITAQGTEENLLDFYGGNTHTWRINQKPNGETPGLNFSTLGSSRLFIEQSSGNVGISTDQPQAQLHIKQTGNTDALRIDDELTDTTPLVIKNDGDVGIGTTDPEEKLEVAGFLTVGNKGDNSVIKFKATNNKTAEIGVQNNDDQGFYVNTRGEYRLSVNQNGNIGIGTTEAKAKLHIENGKNVRLKDKESGYLILGSVDGPNIAIDKYGIMAREDSNPTTLHLQDSGDLVINSSVFIRDNGKIGIGKGFPEAQVHIENTSNAKNILQIDGFRSSLIINKYGNFGIGTTEAKAKLHIENGKDVTLKDKESGYLILGSVNEKNIAIDNNQIMARYNSDPDLLWLQNEGGGLIMHHSLGNSKEIRITNDSNVGIGTVDPKTKLHIENGKDVRLRDKESGYLILGSVNEKNIAIDNNEIMARNNSMPETLHIQAEGGDLVIYDQQSQGKITISPYHVMFGNMISITPLIGTIEASTVQALLVNRSSDDRVKTNPKKLNKKQALEILDQLNFVDYEWIPEYCSGKKGRGIYAQEVRSLLPEAVSVSPEKILDNGEVVKDFLSVDYNWIFVTGMAAIQELKQQNEQLWEEIKHLKKAINSFPKSSRTEI